MAQPRYNGTIHTDHRPARRCRAVVDTRGRILDCAAVSCVFRGTDRFHDWFVERYGPVTVVWREDGWEFERRWDRNSAGAWSATSGAAR